MKTKTLKIILAALLSINRLFLFNFVLLSELMHYIASMNYCNDVIIFYNCYINKLIHYVVFLTIFTLKGCFILFFLHYFIKFTD